MRDGIEPRKSGSGLGFLTEERGPAAEAERSRLLAGGGGGGCGRETLARLVVGCCSWGPIRPGLIRVVWFERLVLSVIKFNEVF